MTMAALGIDLVSDAAAIAVISMASTGQSVCLFLAFMPPKWYLTRINAGKNVESPTPA